MNYQYCLPQKTVQPSLHVPTHRRVVRQAHWTLHRRRQWPRCLPRVWQVRVARSNSAEVERNQPPSSHVLPDDSVHDHHRGLLQLQGIQVPQARRNDQKWRERRTGMTKIWFILIKEVSFDLEPLYELNIFLFSNFSCEFSTVRTQSTSSSCCQLAPEVSDWIFRLPTPSSSSTPTGILTRISRLKIELTGSDRRTRSASSVWWPSTR